MSQLVHDLRFSVRRLLRRPFYPFMAVIILAIGLSAGIAVFTYINGFSQPFPGVRSEGLVRIFGIEDQDPNQNLSYLDFLDYSERLSGLEGLAATQPFYAASVRRERLTEVAFLEAVSGGYFEVLDIEMSAGRGILAADDRPGADAVAVISHDWWQRSFNGDRSVIGSTIYLNFRPFTLVGVASPQFLGTVSSYRPDAWIPIAPFRDRYVSWARSAENRDLPLVRVFGRLKGDASLEQVEAELKSVAAGLDEAYPRKTFARGVRIGDASWIDPRVRLAEQPTVRLMILTAGVLLLLVCANVANLLLSVAMGRQHEISMRAALGASPLRLLRQVLFENLLLSLAAGAAALLLAGPATARLGSYFARPSVWGENVARQVSIDSQVVIFALIASLLTGLFAGLLPALKASRRNLLHAIKKAVDAPRRAWGRRLPGIHDLLVSAQAALSVLLLVVAGLILRTLLTVGSLEPGFDYSRLLVTHISTSSTTMKPDERDRFFRELARRVSQEPWVRSASVADFPLLSPHPSAAMRLEGRDEPVPLVYSKVIPGFFEAFDIHLSRGRSFGDSDVAGAPDVAMINQALAQRFFPGQEALGRRIRWRDRGAAERVYEIVGVAADTKTQDFLLDPEPTVYFSYPQHAYPTGSALMLATTGDPAAAAPLLYQWLRDFEPHLAIVNVVPYTEVVSGFLYTHRMNAELFSLLAFLGLGLAAVGIFSVASLSVSRRKREIGIRMSIGAKSRDIGRLVIGRALTPVFVGLGVGLTVSLAGTELVRSLLYGVQPTDPLTLGVGTLVLVISGLSAAYFPARRASRVDPVIALRCE